MKLVVGLGNPGSRYALTRHNVGFRVVERIARDRGFALDEWHFGGRFGLGCLPLSDGRSERIAILAPETWMNRSGDAVAAAVEELPVDDCSSDLVIVLDDVDLPFGRLRVRRAGGAGGHKGLAHVILRLSEIGVDRVPRLRFGVGRPASDTGTSAETVDWVLAPFSADEEASLERHIATAALAVQIALSQGLTAAMDRFNRDPADVDGGSQGTEKNDGIQVTAGPGNSSPPGSGE